MLNTRGFISLLKYVGILVLLLVSSKTMLLAHINDILSFDSIAVTILAV